MITVPLPALREQVLTLEPDDPTRGARGEGGAVPPLGGRITLGGPYAVAVTADYVADDRDLRAFVENEAAHRVYHIVHMSVSFAGEPARPRLHRAAIEIRLSGTAAPEPVAWSMSPLRVTDSVQVERSFRLGPELKLHDVEVSGAEVEQKESWQRTQVFLQAQRVLRSDPAWEFTRTKTMSMYGSYRLIMVVRAARDEVTSFSGTVTAATRGNLLRRYRRELPDPLVLNAEVGAQ
jgi:hypothetical protein